MTNDLDRDHSVLYKGQAFQLAETDVFHLWLVLCGGDKKSQKADIAQAVRMKEEIERGGKDTAV